jgi:hypothetical protein
MAFLGDIGRSVNRGVASTPPPAFRIHRVGGMLVDVPGLDGATVTMFQRSAVVGKRVVVGGIAQFADLAPGNYQAVVTYGPGTGSAWSVVVTPSSYTVTRLGGGGVTGYIAVG